MRTLTSQEEKALEVGHPVTHVRVRIKDGGGTFRDLTNLFGRDWLSSVDLDRDVDQPVAVASFYARRSAYSDSLSSQMLDSRFNLLTGSYSPLMSPGRELVVETATLLPGVTPASGDWREVFRGDLEEPDFAADPITFSARDLGGRLQDLQIEADRVYGSDVGDDVEDVMQAIIKDAHGEAFETAHVYSAGSGSVQGDRVTPTTQNGFWYRVTTGGTSGGSEPTWPTTIGSTVTSGSVTFTAAGRVPTLYVPSSPGFEITTYVQKPMSVLDAIRTLAQLIGWDVRYLWRSGTDQFELTFSEPDRAGAAGSVYTWDADHYFTVPGFKVDRTDVRNRIQVVYSDPADLDPAGQPKRKTVTKEDKDSQNLYSGGLPRFGQIAEAATSQINTDTEAEDLADAVLADLKDPVALAQFETPYFYAAECGDIYTFAANGVHHSTDLDLAVTKVHHKLSLEGCRTTLDVRGTPVGAVTDWHRIIAGDVVPAKFVPPEKPSGVTVSAVQGGVAVKFTPGTTGSRWKETELHLTTSSGRDWTSSPPDDTTFRGRGTDKIELGDLDPGVTYYGVLVARDKDGNASEPSDEFEIDAGYTPPRAMTPSVPYAELPFNGSFEAWSDANAPPDAWTVVNGTWATNITVDAATSYTGKQSAKFTGQNRQLESQLFPARDDSMYLVWVKFKTSGTAQLYLVVTFYGPDGTTVVGSVGNSGGTATGGFATVFTFVPASASATYCSVKVGSNSGVGGSTDNVWVDDVVVRLQETYVAVAGIGFGTSWQASGVAGYHDPEFWRDAHGTVHLRGLAKNTNAANTLIFTLPVGYRPAQHLIFAISANDAFFAVEVKSNGQVNCRTAPVLNQHHSLSGISFLAEQ